MENNAKLFAKIAKVMGMVRTLEKGGLNSYDRYSYMTADDISRRIGSALAAEGVAFFPSIIASETSEYTTAKGAANFRTVVHMQMTFACTESGAIFTSLWSGEAIDRSDKSISKAAVSATKYFLIKTFLLSGGEDDDADAESPQVETRKPKSAATTAATNSYHDDELWEPSSNTPKQPDTVSVAQLNRITTLGESVYGKEFSANADKLAEFASQGARHTLAELKPIEGDKLIRSLERKLETAKQPHANGVAA